VEKKLLKLLNEATPFFSVLQEEVRQEIISLLFEVDRMSVTEITSQLSLSRPAVSHHLKILLQADLVGFEKRGKERLYYLKTDCMKLYIINLLELIEKN
jgi:DNA-binding transcriptional ArsR family regulator